MWQSGEGKVVRAGVQLGDDPGVRLPGFRQPIGQRTGAIGLRASQQVGPAGGLAGADRGSRRRAETTCCTCRPRMTVPGPCRWCWVFHGGRGSGKRIAQMTGFSQLADEKGFICRLSRRAGWSLERRPAQVRRRRAGP